MDVVVALLVKLREDKNLLVCKEEIKDLYCMKIVVLDEIRRRHEEQMKSVSTNL